MYNTALQIKKAVTEKSSFREKRRNVNFISQKVVFIGQSSILVHVLSKHIVFFGVKC